MITKRVFQALEESKKRAFVGSVLDQELIAKSEILSDIKYLLDASEMISDEVYGMVYDTIATLLQAAQNSKKDKQIQAHEQMHAIVEKMKQKEENDRQMEDADAILDQINIL